MAGFLSFLWLINIPRCIYVTRLISRLGSSDPATPRLDPTFKGTGKALLGQQLPLKGDTVTTKVSDWLSKQQPGKLLKGLRGKKERCSSMQGQEPQERGRTGAVDRTFLHTLDVSFAC